MVATVCLTTERLFIFYVGYRLHFFAILFLFPGFYYNLNCCQLGPSFSQNDNTQFIVSGNDPYRPNDVLQRLTDGNERAFKQIYDRYWLSIYRTVKRYTKSPEVAEDIVQEIFTTLWNNRSGFKAVINLEYYLITMAKNLTYKTLRKMAFEKSVKVHWSEEGVDQEISGSDVLLDQEYAQLIENAVGLLPSQQKQIFRMAKVEGLSHKDIAAQLKISHLTVKTHMAKALRSIRHYLQPHLSHYFLGALLISV